jgi:hypothetical protein
MRWIEQINDRPAVKRMFSEVAREIVHENEKKA